MAPKVPRTPANEAFFGALERAGRPLPPRKDGSPRDPYLEQGSHPDCVERVWKQLNAALPSDCRAEALGLPVLADPKTGRVLAMPYGTSYALWLSGRAHEAAVAAGLRPVHRWAGGRVTDLEEEFGEGWLFGAWKGEEEGWLRSSLPAGDC